MAITRSTADLPTAAIKRTILILAAALLMVASTSAVASPPKLSTKEARVIMRAELIGPNSPYDVEYGTLQLTGCEHRSPSRVQCIFGFTEAGNTVCGAIRVSLTKDGGYAWRTFGVSSPCDY